ncbi:hypothetical protein AU488_11470 [Lonsdalea populi]|nr:hypothetical protein AU487_04430 [Lonsdalea populi]RAT22165.1 hypothetical protein AU488_11470 [Lonsdalea populi]RAT35728.1 hypothetical protein AU493_09890 [Lonsdalea populi]RAT65635.1 hypothetical protein AU502_01995 [Lonsdalea populi]RAT68753.1 hypothetical protein AU503_01315 [Lonsdalea populi]
MLEPSFIASIVSGEEGAQENTLMGYHKPAAARMLLGRFSTVARQQRPHSPTVIFQACLLPAQ